MTGRRALAALTLAVMAAAGCTPPSDRGRVPDSGVRPVVDITPERRPQAPACGGAR